MWARISGLDPSWNMELGVSQAPRRISFPPIFDTSYSSLMTWNLQCYPAIISNETMWHFKGSVKTYSDPSLQGRVPYISRIYGPGPIIYYIPLLATGAAKRKNIKKKKQLQMQTHFLANTISPKYSRIADTNDW